MALFRQVFAVDTNGVPVAGASGTIHPVDDTVGATPPLAITDTAGVPMATVAISDAGVNQAFLVDDHTQVRWVSEDKQAHVIFESLEAMEARAASAEATALSALSQVTEFLNQVGVPGGVAALNSEGHVVDANAEIVGNDTRRAGAVVWAYGSTTPRPTGSRDVMVIWVTEGPSPVNAVPGVDVHLNAGVIR